MKHEDNINGSAPLRIVQSSFKTVPVFPASNSGLLCPETQKLYFQYHGYCTNSVLLYYQTIHIFVSSLPSIEIMLSLFPYYVVTAAITTCITFLFISFLVFPCYKDLSLAKKQDDVALETFMHTFWALSWFCLQLIITFVFRNFLLACVTLSVPKIDS